MSDEAPEPVLFELLTPHIALVTLNRPEKRNAISPEVAAAMDAIVNKIEFDPEIRVVAYFVLALIWARWRLAGDGSWTRQPAALAALSISPA